MAEGATGGSGTLTKGARITGDQRSSLATSFGERYAGGESIRSIAEDTGRSYGFVHGVLKESGASLRGRGGATRGPRRTPLDQLAPPPAAAAGTASPAATKARATAKAGVEDTDDPGQSPVDKVVDKVKVKVKGKADKAAKAEDDKPKKKSDAKKAAKKAKKG